MTLIDPTCTAICIGPIGTVTDAAGRATGATVPVGNNVAGATLDFTSTVVIDLAPGVAATGVQVTTGTAVIQGSQVVWNNFSLSSGQTATATVSLVATGGGAQSASGGASIRSVTADAINTTTGQRLTAQSGPGGPAVAALAAAAGPAAPASGPAAPAVPGVAAPVALTSAPAAAAAAGAAPAAVAAAVPAPGAAPGGPNVTAPARSGQAVAAPATAAPAAPAALPRTGDPRASGWALPALLVGLGSLTIGIWLVLRRRARLWEQ